MIIGRDLFLEVLLLRIRGETIKFTTELKRTNSKVEKQLIADIETLESQDPDSGLNSTLLQDKKAELKLIRSNKISGQMIRSRLNWLQQGEKPSKYLTNLENKNFVEKTIKNHNKTRGDIT